MTKVISDKKALLYQTYMEEDTELYGEPALLIEAYSDVVSISQADNSVSVNYETIPSLIKVLKALYVGKDLNYEKL